MDTCWVLYQTAEQPEPIRSADRTARAKTLSGAAILCPKDTTLSETALETIRYMREYTYRRGGLVLLSDRVGVMTDAAPPEEMLRAAREAAARASEKADAFSFANMQDGGGIRFNSDLVFGFRPFPVFPPGGGTSPVSKEVLADILRACEAGNIIAMVYHREAEYRKHTGKKKR